MILNSRINTIHNRVKNLRNEWTIHSVMVFFGLLFFAQACSDITGSGWHFYVDSAYAASEDTKELQLKAAFIFNFMKFVEWPEKKLGSDKKQYVVVGVLGEDNFQGTLDILKQKTIREHPIKIFRIEGFSEFLQSNKNATFESYINAKQDEINSCYVLYISNSENQYFKEILKSQEKSPILTISGILNFIDLGGVIEFVTEDNKIRFDINYDEAAQKQLKINSQLLQLARKVIKKETSKTSGDSPGNRQ